VAPGNDVVDPTTDNGNLDKQPSFTLGRGLERVPTHDEVFAQRAPERANDFLSTINPVRLRADVFGSSALNEGSKVNGTGNCEMV
jgi:hypothetical protein